MPEAGRPGAAIRVRGLRKSYDGFEALRGIDFEVAHGEVFGLLGPNGAGKTTTVEILEGLRARSAGEVTVLGLDPERETRSVKEVIGASLQATNLPDKMRVLEAVDLFAAFYTTPAEPPALLRRLQLWEKRNAFYATLSGGQKQRLALALALVNQPKVLFLDEPTTGLDAQVRLEIHSLIEELRQRGATILLTTHYIEEAERLCDRVAIVDEGRIMAMGTPRQLQESVVGSSRVEILCETPFPAGGPPGWPAEWPYEISADGRSMQIVTPRPARAVVSILRWMEAHGAEPSDLHILRPTLEDVFLRLTGKSLRD